MYSRSRTPSFTRPQTPTRSFASLSLDDSKSYVFRPLEDNDDDEDESNVITPKAFTSYVPTRPSRVDVPEHLLLSNKPITKPLQKQKIGDEVYRVASSKELLKAKPRLTCVVPASTPPRLTRAFDSSISLSSSTNSLKTPLSSRSASTSSISLLPDSTISNIRQLSPEEVANLIIQPNNDKIEFHVQSSIIAAASPMLAASIKAIFGSSERMESPPDGKPLPVYKMEEDLKVLDGMLRFCYPKKSAPVLRSIEQLARLLKACTDYQISPGVQQLRLTLVQFAKQCSSGKMLGSPFECYGVACRFNFHDAAKAISTYCMMVDSTKVDLGHTLAGVAVEDVKRLTKFLVWRATKATDILNQGVDSQEFWCDGCSGSAGWYGTFVDRAEVELKKSPTSYHIFSSTFIAGCLTQAMAQCDHCIVHYLHAKTQIRFAVLQRDINSLKDTI